jgi:hypothetical protein
MKFIFVDEFKPETNKSDGERIYGISVVLLDSAYYSNYKNGFETEFTNLGWSKEKELKGRYVYSHKIFEDITPEKRIEFAENLFKLSSSESGKNTRITVFICFEYFNKDITEEKIYTDLLCRVIKKIDKPANKKKGKNLIAFFLDSNDNVTKRIKEIDFYSLLSKDLHKDWVIFEKPLFVTSSSLLPGIIFADFISYFHQNFIDTRCFFDKTKLRFIELLDKEVSQLSNSEKEELKSYMTNFKKQKQSTRIMSILKNVVYV